MKKVNLAVVGATGMVGRTFLKVLKERNFPINNLYLMASKRSAGTTLEYDAQPIAPGDARQVTLTFDSRGARGWQLKALDITLAGGQRPLRLFVEADIK